MSISCIVALCAGALVCKGLCLLWGRLDGTGFAVFVVGVLVCMGGWAFFTILLLHAVVAETDPWTRVAAIVALCVSIWLRLRMIIGQMTWKI